MDNFPKTINKEQNRLDETKILLSFKKSIEEKELSKILSEFGLKIFSLGRKKIKGDTFEVNNTDKRYWATTTNNKPIERTIYQGLEKKLKVRLDWIGPVYEGGTGERRGYNHFCPLPSVLLILKELSTNDDFQGRIKKLGLVLNTPKSKYLSDHNYFEIPNLLKASSYQIANELEIQPSQYHFEQMPMFRDFCLVPNDPFYANQWNMTQINAPGAWDFTTGVNTVSVAVIDSGVDLTHPDLQPQILAPGIDLGDMVSDGSPNNFGSQTGHGTCCSGIVAATFNNSLGVTGIAGNCRVIPVAISTFSDAEIANGINWSTAQGASVISMSFSIGSSALVDTEINNAFLAGVTLCAATGNGDSTGIGYPSRNPQVIACGASSTDDNRKTSTSPDGENWWGSDYGNTTYSGQQTGVSVVAPGVLIPTTDIQGPGGYNSAAGVAGNYNQTFNGTSSATPLVAGCAALIRSNTTGLSGNQVRDIIEKTAAKVGALAYAEQASFFNGTRNDEMGYGRIDIFQALDFADVMIKDWSGDDGTEPSTPPSNNWWSYSDIVVRITDDNVFNPSDPAQSKNVERGQPNYIYVRVTNNGPQEARNVIADFRITPYVGLQFVYPNDWTLEDSMHVKPTAVDAAFATIASGASVIAKFTISAAQTDVLYGWQYANPWHPCLLASVNSDNDYAFASSDLTFGNLVLRKNNIAQRNLSVINVFASAFETASLSSPFVAGNRANMERSMFIEVDRSNLPQGSEAYLLIDDNEDAFPLVDFKPRHDNDDRDGSSDEDCDCENDALNFLDRTRVRTRFGCCEGILTLEKGSVLQFVCATKKLKIRNIKGGNLRIEDGKRMVAITGNRMTVEVEKAPGSIVPMSVRTVLPANLQAGEQYSLTISQRNARGVTVGGADTVYRLT